MPQPYSSDFETKLDLDDEQEVLCLVEYQITPAQYSDEFDEVSSLAVYRLDTGAQLALSGAMERKVLEEIWDSELTPSPGGWDD